MDLIGTLASTLGVESSTAQALAGTVLDVTQGGEVHGFNGDGSIAVGTAYQGAANGWFDANR